MVTSEYLRTVDSDRKQELKYLIFAFCSFLLNSFLDVLISANVVFGDFDISQIASFWPVLDVIFDLFALMLLLNAFIYPVFKKRIALFKLDLKLQIIGLFFIGLIVESFWLLEYKNSNFYNFWGEYILVFIKLILISYALYELYFHSTEEFKYRGNVFLAFWLYLMVPLLHFSNIIFFENNSIRLRLLEEPFPLFAILLLTQVTYLKLVDKFYLRQKLFETEKKYKVEKEISEMKDEFVSVVSHELRTPLTSMKLYISLMNNEKFGAVNAKQKEALLIIRNESDRLTNLIEDILTLSKIEAGKMNIKIEEFDLNDLKNPIHYVGAKEKDIGVIFYMPPKFLVKVDRAKIIQIFVNLMSNAVKFTEEHGKITVACEDLGKEWSLSIADNGKGIPKEEIPKLFSKFYQVEEHMTRTKGGSGLGLAIVKNIVDLHKGRIEVKSEIDKGSRFTIYIPKDIENKSEELKFSLD